MEGTIMKQLQSIVRQFPDKTAQKSKDPGGHYRPTDFQTLYRETQEAAAAFLSIGVERGETVGMIMDNRKEWLLCDLGLLSIGANDAPRGCDTTPAILAHILSIPACSTVVLENSHQLEKVLEVREKLAALKQIIMIEPAEEETSAKAEAYTVLNFKEFIERGRKALSEAPMMIEEEIEKGRPEDAATIIFTSGTTGIPKGVVLTNQNYVYQAEAILDYINVTEQDTWLTILPVWHSFERVIQYVAVLNGACLAYSKPVGKTLLMDLQSVKPTLMAAVPRLWEALYAGVCRNVRAKGRKTERLFGFFLKAAGRDEYFKCILENRYPDYTGAAQLTKKVISFAGRGITMPLRSLGDKLLFGRIVNKIFPKLRAGISGGGALQKNVDNFYASIGVKVLEGYGLTESGPVISVRDEKHPVVNTVGSAFIGTEIKVLDQDGRALPPGKRGVLHVRGPQVMTGYYKDPDLTATVLSEEGWLDTGDIAVVSRNNEISLVGRAKDTIVLLGGENVEPVPLESKLKESCYIENAVVLGQDQKYLSALIIPNFDALEEYAEENGIMYENRTLIGETPELKELLNQEVADLISPTNGFSSFERIYQFAILHNHFEVGRELSAKMELLRPKIYELYAENIKELLSR